MSKCDARYCRAEARIGYRDRTLCGAHFDVLMELHPDEMDAALSLPVDPAGRRNERENLAEYDPKRARDLRQAVCLYAYGGKPPCTT